MRTTTWFIRTNGACQVSPGQRPGLLGNPQNVALTLKGRPFFGAFWVALSGLVVNRIGTQGVALGYHRIAPSGRQSARRGAGRQSAGARGVVPSVSGKFKYGKSFQDSTTGAGCSRHLGSRHLDVAPSGRQSASARVVGRHSGSSAPTAHAKSAQGNTLGIGNPQNVALKGRPKRGNARVGADKWDTELARVNVGCAVGVDVGNVGLVQRATNARIPNGISSP